MKLALLSLAACLVSGCLKPVPPPPEVPQVVVVTQVTPPTAPEIIPEVDAGPPLSTWMSEEEAKAEARKRGECVCDKGDPLCSCDDPQPDSD